MVPKEPAVGAWDSMAGRPTKEGWFSDRAWMGAIAKEGTKPANELDYCQPASATIHTHGR